MVRVLAVTLYSGENEYEECCASVKRQVGVDLAHRVISHRPKREAHQELYHQFNEERDSFDFFIKIDADMVLSRDDVIISIIGSFDDKIDVVSYTVWDRLTASRIGSINCFRNTCEFFPEQNDKLFTDRLPIRFGGRHVWVDDKDNLVLHAPNPTDFQAFMFGIHRGFKVVQKGAVVPSLESSYSQMKILKDVWNNYRSSKDIKALAAVIAGGLVLTGQISEVEFVDKEMFQKYFDDVEITSEKAAEFCDLYNSSAAMNLIKIFGVSGVLRGLAFAYRRKGVFGLFKRQISLLVSRMAWRG